MSNEVITSRKKQGRLAGKVFVRKKGTLLLRRCSGLYFYYIDKSKCPPVFDTELIKDLRKFEY